MFKFGKSANPTSYYAQHSEAIPRSGRTSATASLSNSLDPVKRRKIVTADNCNLGIGGGGSGGNGVGGLFGGGNGMGGADSYNSGGTSVGAGPGYNTDRYNPVFDQLEEGTVLEDWIPRDGAGMDMLFRRMYLRDPTLGPGIDLMRNLPWSDFTLSGVQDKQVLRIYEEMMEALHIQRLMPDLTGDYLVVGRSVSSLIFDERNGIFSGIIPHDPDFIRVSPMPVYGFDPLCDFKLSPGFRKFLISTDPRCVDARKALPTAFLDAARSDQGFLPLDPLSTLYLGRTVSQTDKIGTSILTRCLYFWGIEKALLNAQLTSVRRRSRSFVHLMAGIDKVWEPTPEELDALAGMLIQVSEDPVGGVVATRTGVTINEPVGGGQDFYKWSDEIDLFSKYKMQALGISQALLDGDATYANAESARSVFVENLAWLRSRIVEQMFYDKIFPTVARLHGFQKRTQAEIDHNIRIGGSTKPWAQVTPVLSSKLSTRRAMQMPTNTLIMPQIEWTKSLKPDQDMATLEVLERLKQNDFPVTLQMWANAAGVKSKSLYDDVKKDKELLHRIETLSFDTADAGNGESGDESVVENPGKQASDTPEAAEPEAPAAEESEAPPETEGELPEGLEIPVQQALAQLKLPQEIPIDPYVMSGAVQVRPEKK